MAINFPSSPATNDTFTGPTGLEYIFDGVKWRSFKPSEPVVGTFNANSAISLSAGGTNQNITLTPSGTGVVTTPASVGIGTTAPASKLQVTTTDGVAPVNTSGSNALRLRSTTTAAVGVGPSIFFEGQTGNATANYGFAAIQAFKGSATASDYSGTLAFYTQNSGGATALTERMRIDSAGNVGIGTSTPTQKLSVTVADAAQAIQLRGANGMVRIRPYVDATNGTIIDGSNIAESAYLPLTLTGSTLRLFGNNGSGIAIDATGNIGMGTTSPLTGTTTFVNAKDPVISGDGGYFGGGLYYDAAWKNSVASQGGWALRNTGGVFTVYTGPANGAAGSVISASERMRIDSAGLVGIATGGTTRFALSLGTTTSTGTATPITLDLGGTYSSTAGANLKLRLYWDGTNAFGLGISSNQLDYVVPASASHVWYIAGTERIRIAANGNVGIGTTTPTQKLSVTVADASQAIQLRGASGMFRIRPYVDATNGVIIDSSNIVESAYLPLTLTGSTLRLFGNNGSGIAIDATGNIGMGTTSPLTGTTTFVNAKDPVISGDGGYFGGGLYYDTAWKNSVASQGGWALRNTGGVFTVYTGPANGAAGSVISASERIRIAANGNVGIANTTPSVALEVTGNIKDTLGLVRAAPIQTKSGAYVVVAADAGATIYISTGGVTINASILSAGDMITIVNNSASNQTITAGASVTFRLAGTATTGNRTLAQYGMATFLCVVGGATPTFHCSGAGLT